MTYQFVNARPPQAPPKRSRADGAGIRKIVAIATQPALRTFTISPNPAVEEVIVDGSTAFQPKSQKETAAPVKIYRI